MYSDYLVNNKFNHKELVNFALTVLTDHEEFLIRGRYFSEKVRTTVAEKMINTPSI